VNEEHKKFIKALGRKDIPKSNLKKQTYVIPNYDPSMQLGGIRQFIHCLRMESAGNSSSNAIAKSTQAYSHERGGDAYADDCAEAMYFDTTVSGEMVASFAQYLEGLFKYEFYRLSQKNTNHIKLGSQRYKGIESAILKKCKHKTVRSEALKNQMIKNYWDPHYYINENGECNKSIVKGICDLSDLHGISKNLPSDYEEVLTAIFQYRNYVMHNGVEWERKEIVKFKQIIEKLSFVAFQ
jgi:hypothetical protein